MTGSTTRDPTPASTNARPRQRSAITSRRSWTTILLASGQVGFLPMVNVFDDGHGTVTTVSQLTGEERTITVTRKVVDARYLESSIPANHTPNFIVDEGVRCIPVNDLVRSDHPAGGYVVLGAGKTAMDACTWLLDNGVDNDDISWVKPRDSWVLDRAAWQPRDKVGSFIIGWAASTEAAASATSIPDLFDRLEECGHLKRLDPSIEPTMYRGAILSDHEVRQLRSIGNVVRAGHVRRIQSDRIVLDAGEVAGRADRLYVDCTADGLPRPPTRPIFEGKRVTIQQVRESSPTFNAALLGHFEATLEDIDEQNRLAPANAYQSSALDWIRARHVGMIAQRTWNQIPDLGDWLDRSRLNVAAGLLDHADEARRRPGDRVVSREHRQGDREPGGVPRPNG